MNLSGPCWRTGGWSIKWGLGEGRLRELGEQVEVAGEEGDGHFGTELRKLGSEQGHCMGCSVAWEKHRQGGGSVC